MGYDQCPSSENNSDESRPRMRFGGEDEAACSKMEIPSYFKCPISLCLMTEPVSICTGITYDRSSIEKWFEEGRKTCPVTMQALESHDLIPNHTLRRIIQTWCAANRLGGGGAGEGRSNPRKQQQQPMELQDARRIVRELQHPSTRLDALKRLKEKVRDCEKNRDCLSRAGLGRVLVSLFSSGSLSSGCGGDDDDQQADVLGLLAQIGLDDESRKAFMGASNLAAIAWLLQRGDLQARISAATVLEDLALDKEARLDIGSTQGVFEGLVRLVREDHRHRPAIRASLRAVLAICPPMKNRVRLVESGAVAPLVELMPDSDRSLSESVLAVLECLCGCAEGRAAVSRHALAVPAITKKLFKASDMATEYAIDVLWAVCKYCPDEGVRKRMVEVGLFPKLFFFLQIGCNPRTKQKAGDLLKLLHRAYRECVEGSSNNNTCLLSA